MSCTSIVHLNQIQCAAFQLGVKCLNSLSESDIYSSVTLSYSFLAPCTPRCTCNPRSFLLPYLGSALFQFQLLSPKDLAMLFVWISYCIIMSLICSPSSLLLSVICCFLSNYFRILYLFCACDVVRCSSCLCCCFLLLLFFCFLCPSVFHMCSITVLLLSHCFLLSLFLCTSVF